ncbi:MAG: hypothetical protein Kow0063_33760 [Anaerolineae bacterium]
MCRVGFLLALQRVDRSASARGLAVYTPFLALDVVDYAMRIPSQCGAALTLSLPVI